MIPGLEESCYLITDKTLPQLPPAYQNKHPGTGVAEAGMTDASTVWYTAVMRPAPLWAKRIFRTCLNWQNGILPGENSMKALVTGATGFIGSHVAEKLDTGRI
ncbi:MAG: hypothetical protein U5N58_02015 [Actinomycetota bacterium]|nr:hypothetical protein [Actinomycetota bacterium]